MKKGLLGCFVMVVVLGVVVGGGIYYFVYKPFLSDYVDGFARLAEISELNAQIQNKAPFTPPADGILTEKQVKRFVDVQQEMRIRMGERLEDLEARYESILEDWRRAGEVVDYREGFSAFKGLMGVIVEAKRIQVDALNRHDFSLEEYDWVRAEIYRAAGVEMPHVLLSELAGAVKDGEYDPEAVRARLETSGEVPAQNRRLVRAHEAQLQEAAGFAWLGL